MKRTAKRKGLGPAGALALLAVCGGIALFSMREYLFGAGAAAPKDATTFAVEEPDPAADAPKGDREGGDVDLPGRDLLAEHGSWAGAAPVRMAFASLLEVAIQAAPAGETSSGSRWVGADPPTLHVGVLMVGETTRRAVVDGAVVGVGDRVAKSTIVAIDRDCVAVLAGGRRLTYDLENEYPREFRAELQRRGAVQRDAAAPGKSEEGQ